MATEGNLESLRSFLATPLERALADAGSEAAERQAVVLFHNVAATVPAYRAFLREHGIDPAGVVGFEDFRGLPLTSKENHPAVSARRTLP